MMKMDDMIDVQDLPPYMRLPRGRASSEGPAAPTSPSVPQGGTLEEQERILIVLALEAAGGNQSQAARALRIGRDALRYKLKKHNLETTRSERGSATGG
jgi:DNA-binding NtrC family response regulator